MVIPPAAVFTFAVKLWSIFFCKILWYTKMLETTMLPVSSNKPSFWLVYGWLFRTGAVCFTCSQKIPYTKFKPDTDSQNGFISHILARQLPHPFITDADVSDTEPAPSEALNPKSFFCISKSGLKSHTVVIGALLFAALCPDRFEISH